MNFRTLLGLALLVANTAWADVTVGPTTQTWTGNIVVKRNGTSVFNGVGTLADCPGKYAADAGLAARANGTYSYTCQQTEIDSATVTKTATVIPCATQQPPDQTQTITQLCPAGTYGTYNYAQTRPYSLFLQPKCWDATSNVWSPTSPPLPPVGACSSTPPSGTYATTFSTPELILSENGNWSRAANQWTNVTTANSFAVGTNGITNSYDDSYSILRGSQYGNDYTITAVAYRSPSVPSNAVNEIEILGRCTDTPTTAKCYEVSFVADGQLGAAVWLGAFGQFDTNIPNQTYQPSSKVLDGTVFKVQFSGSSIKGWRDGVLIFQATDTRLPTGNPGIGFFIRPGYVQGYGWKSYSITTP